MDRNKSTVLLTYKLFSCSLADLRLLSPWFACCSLWCFPLLSVLVSWFKETNTAFILFQFARRSVLLQFKTTKPWTFERLRCSNFTCFVQVNQSCFHWEFLYFLVSLYRDSLKDRRTVGAGPAEGVCLRESLLYQLTTNSAWLPTDGELSTNRLGTCNFISPFCF